MNKILWNVLLFSPVVLGGLSGNLAGAIAAETTDATVVSNLQTSTDNSAVLDEINSNQADVNDVMEQITGVSQMRDVRPGDWAYESLRSIVERYGCLAGYPDGTFRGNRSLSRYEFAAGLNACLGRITQLIGATTNDNSARKQDLVTLQRLTQEFTSELAIVRSRVDALEAKTAELEANQFSTTTKLNGEVIMAIAGVAAGQNAVGEDIPKITAFGTRTRLNFDTSFTGQDLLRTRLQISNLASFSGTSTFTPEGDLRFSAGAFENGDNSVGLDALLYSFPISPRTVVFIEANAGAPDDFTNTVNPYLDGDGSTGALTDFGTRNPIYYLLNNAGIGVKHEFSDNLELSLGYLANSPEFPSSKGNGIFNGAFGALAQLTVKPSDRFTVGLTYIHAYNNDFTANGATGSNRANLRSALLANPNLPSALAPFAGLELPISTNAYGIQASFQINPRFVLGGWVGYTKSRTLASLVGSDGSLLDRGDFSTWNYAVTLAFPDLGKKGSVAGIIVGMEPKVTQASSALSAIKDRDTSLHIEGFYQYPLTDNISITPGIVWLTAPDHNNNNKDVVIGAIRTTFSF